MVVITHEADVAAHAKQRLRMHDGRIVSDERLAAVTESAAPLEAQGDRIMSIPEAAKFAWRGVHGEQGSILPHHARGDDRRRRSDHPGRRRLRRGRQRHRATINSLGTNTLTITPGTTSALPGSGGPFARPSAQADSPDGTLTRAATLTIEDAGALQDPGRAPDVLRVAPVVNATRVTATLAAASQTVETTVGTTPAYLAINNETIAQGRAFSQSDFDTHSRVLLVGPTVATALAGGDGSAILNQVVRLNGKEFTVIGLLQAKGSTGPQDSDDRVIAPATAVQDHLAGYGNLSSISAQATSSDTVDAAQRQIEVILDGRHRTSPDDRDYTVISSATFLNAANTITGTFTILLGAIAGISLFVGGIGVMNIMLVTVTERTREIGIRRAIGAERSSIVTQFLIEAAMICGIGGIIGILIGTLGSRIAGKLLMQMDIWPSLNITVGAFVLSVTLGILFGIYPAAKASKLQPVEALRAE